MIEGPYKVAGHGTSVGTPVPHRLQVIAVLPVHLAWVAFACTQVPHVWPLPYDGHLWVPGGESKVMDGPLHGRVTAV